MTTRAGLALAVALLALTAVGGGAAMRARTAVPPAAIVSLVLRTHQQHMYPIRDLDGLAPNGQWIAFVSRRGNEDFQLRTSRLDGSSDRVLVTRRFPNFIMGPRWSPNGREIAFTSPTDGLSLLPAGGGTPRRIADADAEPVWAPDSRRLAFPGGLDSADTARLTVLNEDGSGLRALGGRRPIYSLSWSADGKRLVYATTDAGWEAQRDTGRIYAVEAATGAEKVVTRGVQPAWSHDAKFLSFVRRVKGRMTLYVLGRGRRRALRSGYGFIFAPAWSRKGAPPRVRGDEPLRAVPHLHVRRGQLVLAEAAHPAALWAGRGDRLVARRAQAAVRANGRLSPEGVGAAASKQARHGAPSEETHLEAAHALAREAEEARAAQEGAGASAP